MPELPEVELISKALNQLVGGFTIARAKLIRKKLVPETTPKSFARILKNAKLERVSRRGKHILFGLDNKKTLITHLRMSGRFMLLPSEKKDPKFTHAAFYFDNESRLIFQDQRHFGHMKIVETENLSETKEIKKLAPEPFSEEFSKIYFQNVLKASRRSLKELLLDQTRVCGLGNIYATEAMFLSRLNPQIPANEVSAVKANRLHRFIIEVLRESIGYSSTLNIDPENIEESYYGGKYKSHWRVYAREGKECPVCNRKIRRVKQGGRSSYYCPRCQRK